MARAARQGRRRTSLGAGVAVLYSLGLVGACKDEATACYDLSVGDRLEVTVVERYDSSSKFPGARPRVDAGCPDGTDIAAGDSLTFAVQRQVIDEEVVNCKTSLLTVENAGDFGWTGVTQRNEGLYPQRPLQAYFTANLAGCEALVQLAVEERRTAAGLEDQSEAGQVPHFVLLRDLVFPGGCAASCSDEFVVSVKKSP